MSEEISEVENREREERGEVTTLSPTTRAYRSGETSDVSGEERSPSEEDNIQYTEENTSSDEE